jgi:nitrate/nitrite transporter NarK
MVHTISLADDSVFIASDIISNSGIDSREKQSVVLVLLGLLKLFFVVVGGKLFDRSGRRKLLFISLLGMAAALFIVSISFWVQPNATTTFIMIGMALYLAFFSVGTGPGSWYVDLG